SSRPEVGPESERLAPSAPLGHQHPIPRDAEGLHVRRALVAATLVITLIGLSVWGWRANRGTGQGTFGVRVMEPGVDVSVGERNPRKPGTPRPVGPSHVETAHTAPSPGRSDRRIPRGQVVRPDPGLARVHLDRGRARIAARDIAGALADANE